MDFIKIKERMKAGGVIQIYPDFIIGRSKDLMVRGKSFYAIWDEENNTWSTDEYDVQRLVDAELEKYLKNKKDMMCSVSYMRDNSSGVWRTFQNYIKSLSDNYHVLDRKVVFENSDVTRKDYSSRKVPYAIAKGSMDAYEELMSTLYDPEERLKLEWAIGSIIAGDSKSIQKFVVLYGDAGSGKSTFLNIVNDLFEGYVSAFEADAITTIGNMFALEAFKSNPLVAIEQDGDLSRIEINSRLNSIVSHEEMTVNEKFKSVYTMKIDTFLFMATNKPVKITDAKSGILRRLIDVHPSGRLIPERKYNKLRNNIKYELGAIAYHCLDTYNNLGRGYYQSYKPIDMMMRTNAFFNFVEENYYSFKEEDGTSLSYAWKAYKDYCEDGLLSFKVPKYIFRDELKAYFRDFYQTTVINGETKYDYYKGFKTEKFVGFVDGAENDMPEPLVFDKKESIFDRDYYTMKAQYAEDGKPKYKWSNCKTILKDIDTTKEHYIKLPLQHIVIDFDLRDKDGNKSLEENLKAASLLPRTYGEVSKSGCGVHLHYIYTGDIERLSNIYSPGIEIKTFKGNSALRRKLTFCNDLPIATISSGLPLKGGKMIDGKNIQDEKHLKSLIKKSLKKEIFPNTKPSIDFIKKITDEAYESGIVYDITDLKHAIESFALSSTNNSDYCMKVVKEIKYMSEKEAEVISDDKKEIVFYDVEVYPNLFIICWKYKDPKDSYVKYSLNSLDNMSDDDRKKYFSALKTNKEIQDSVIRMINPTPEETKKLLQFNLIGFNNRRYDNHIIYARMQGYSNSELYKLSQKIINEKTGFFRDAYNLSYTDVLDFAAEKKGLKKWEIELGIHHQEMGIPWDEDVPENRVLDVADYCANDVVATEILFNHLHGDFVAREILAELAGGSVNDTTNTLTTKLIFGNNKNPQNEFVYTDLSKMFPGYVFENGKSTYRGFDVGEGGFVYAKPGFYKNIKTLDVVSMHPKSAINLGIFGPDYTKIFEELVNIRVAIKHEDYEYLRNAFKGRLQPFLEGSEADIKDTLKRLSYALKIAINSVYGLTSAGFENAFKDPRNKDNIVAKRGALFMIDLLKHCEKKGLQVVHIKTDSIKLVDPSDEDVQEIMGFAKKFYGYDFEIESEYEKFCLVNKAVYIAKTKDGHWDATGKQFAEPYVLKHLFTKEPVLFSDLIQVRNVKKGALYLSDENGNKIFVGSVGAFIPMRKGHGYELVVKRDKDKYDAAPDSKDYFWVEAEGLAGNDREKVFIDKDFFEDKVKDAINSIEEVMIDTPWTINDLIDEEENKEPVPDFMNVPEGIDEELPFK